MVMTGKKQCPPECDTKNHIFMVAARLFAEKGYHALSMREISEQSNVSKPMIYYYFGSKEGIYKALLDSGLQHSRKIIMEIIASDLSTNEKLVEFINKRFQDCVDYPEFSKFYISLFISSENFPFLDQFKADAQKQEQAIKQIIEDGISRGEFRADLDAQLALEVMGGAVMHYVWHHFIGLEPKVSRLLAERIVDLILVGMNKR
jgi:TetR/AcrR family transcriptional regulator